MITRILAALAATALAACSGGDDNPASGAQADPGFGGYGSPAPAAATPPPLPTAAAAQAPAFASSTATPPPLPTTNAATPAAMPAAMTSASGGQPGNGQAVQEHDRGVFFDWRPVRAEAMRIAQTSKPSADQLQRIQVVDSVGFGQPMTALTMEVPAGWRSDSKVDWDKSSLCVWNGPRMSVESTSADGLHGITIFPTMGWQVASMPIDQFDPCPTAPMTTVRDYLEFVARNARPNARVLSYRDRPDLSQPNAQYPTYAGEILIAYSLQGHEMRESLVSSVTHTRLAPGGILVNANIALGVRAPDGLLDFAFAERVRSSLRMDETWYKRYSEWGMGQIQQARQQAQVAIQNWHDRRMNEINLKGMTERHNIRMNTIADIGRINTQIVSSRDASNDRNHERFKDAMQEVQPWRDPTTGQQVDLSMHYQNAWQLNDGRQFLTNDPNFDPNRDLDIGGHRLEPIRR